MLALLQELALTPNQPVYAGSSSQWGDVEKQIGTALPQDYKQLINLYGFGSFGGYVCPLSPFIETSGPNSHLSLFRGMKALSILDPFQIESPGSFQPFPIYPA